MIFERILGIGACDPKGVIGRRGKLPWHCPEDIKHFANTTLGSPIVMGYNTFLSLPEHYFDQRTAIVFTRKNLHSEKYPLLFFVSSMAKFLALEGKFKNLYVIGGAQIYRLFFQENLIQEFVITKMKNLYEGDTFFPLAELTSWSNTTIHETPTFSIHRYTYAHKNV